LFVNLINKLLSFISEYTVNFCNGIKALLKIEFDSKQLNNDFVNIFSLLNLNISRFKIIAYILNKLKFGVNLLKKLNVSETTLTSIEFDSI